MALSRAEPSFLGVAGVRSCLGVLMAGLLLEPWYGRSPAEEDDEERFEEWPDEGAMGGGGQCGGAVPLQCNSFGSAMGVVGSGAAAAAAAAASSRGGAGDGRRYRFMGRRGTALVGMGARYRSPSRCLVPTASTGNE